MTVSIVMPKLGMSMQDGTIIGWYVAEGEVVSKGQAIAEVESEKTTCDIEAPENGVLQKLLLSAGSTCAVGEPIAILVANDRQPVPAVSVIADASPRSPETRQQREETRTDDDFVSLTAIRKTIAARLQTSAQSIPQVTLLCTADAQGLVLARTEHCAAAEAAGVKLAYDDILIYLVGRLLVEHRLLNASFEQNGIRYFHRAHVGLAVALEEGLIVPVVRDAHRLSLVEIAKQRTELVNKAHARRLNTADIEGGTFTISNLGMYPVDFFGALINPPQAGILSIGQIRQQPIVEEGAVVARDVVGLGLTFDHRVADGAIAGRFLSLLLEKLRNPVIS